MKHKRITYLVLGGVFAALSIVASRLLILNIAGIAKFDFNLVVETLSGYFLGPVFAPISFTVADIVGTLFDNGNFGGFNLFFAVLAPVKGLALGFIFYKKSFSWQRIVFSTIIIYLLFDYFLYTAALSFTITHQPLLLALGGRMIKLIMIPIDITILLMLLKPAVVLKKQIGLTQN